MKTLFRRTLLTVASLAPLSAFAHPGHEGDHDFTWTFSHLAAYPLATLGCLGLISTGTYIVWRFASRTGRAETKRLRQRPR